MIESIHFYDNIFLRASILENMVWNDLNKRNIKIELIQKNC